MPTIGNTFNEVSKALPTMGAEGSTCIQETSFDYLNSFALNFARNLRSGCELISEIQSVPDRGGCVVNETFCGDWSSSNWYCADDVHINTYTKKFSHDGRNYSIQAWWQTTEFRTSGPLRTPWFVLYKDNEFVTEIVENNRCRFMGGTQKRDDMLAINEGIKQAIGEDIKICMDNSVIFYCSDML